MLKEFFSNISLFVFTGLHHVIIIAVCISYTKMLLLQGIWKRQAGETKVLFPSHFYHP